VGSRGLDFLRRHPILCLAILTPGIPEYVLTSSSIANLVMNPGWFFLQLAINVGQYTAGALLIREAALRWGKGWATVAFLGLAYAVTEEGLGDNTIFNPHGATAPLGTYGHFLGVNWVWATGILVYHVVFSIGLPILLLGLALPETRGRSLLGTRGIATAFSTLAATTAFECVLVWGAFGFWMGIPLFVGSLLVIGALIIAARRAPPRVLYPTREFPTLTGRGAFALGFLLFPTVLAIEYGVPRLPGVPPVLDMAGLVAVCAVGAAILRRSLGRVGNEPALVMLAYGGVLFVGVFGVLIGLTQLMPVSLPLVGLVVLFFRRLRDRYPARGSLPATATVPGPAPVP
jgi:hypothetical protein